MTSSPSWTARAFSACLLFALSGLGHAGEGYDACRDDAAACAKYIDRQLAIIRNPELPLEKRREAYAGFSEAKTQVNHNALAYGEPDYNTAGRSIDKGFQDLEISVVDWTAEIKNEYASVMQPAPSSGGASETEKSTGKDRKGPEKRSETEPVKAPVTVESLGLKPVLDAIPDSAKQGITAMVQEPGKAAQTISAWFDGFTGGASRLQNGDPKNPSGVNTNGAKTPALTTQDMRQVEAAMDRVRPNDPAVQQAFAEGYIKTGSPLDARRVADRMLSRNPNDPYALSTRARAKALSGDSAGALADARRALELDPNDQAAKFIVANHDALGRSGDKLKRLKLDFGAERQVSALGEAGAAPGAAGGSWETGFKNIAYTQMALPGVSQRFYDSARTKYRVGDFRGALSDATRAADAAPQSALPLVLRAQISRAMENPEGALSDANKALAIAPDDPNVLRERALAFIELGRYSDAMVDLERAIALDPNNGTGYLYRAMVYEKLGRTDDARADLARALAADPALKPLVDEVLARLDGPARGRKTRLDRLSKKLVRGGAISISLMLLLLGLAGSAKGRKAITTTANTLFGRGAKTVLDQPAQELAPGAVLGGNYSIVRELGRGGMGVVYEALDAALQRRVAVKRLMRDSSTTEADFERFLQEARTVAKLRHPRVAEIHNVVVDRDLYLVFEYVDGEPLDRALEKRLRFSLPEARRLLGDVAAAIDAAHAQKIIHRDLKPSNVMLESGGSAKVMDFGIAHQAGTAATQLTRTSASGTPPYMAPEQAMGSVSKASDLYALGVMGYELIMGRRPFQGPDFLEQKLNKTFTPPSSVDPALPKGLDAFFARVFEPDPTKRPASAAELLRSLDASVG